MNDEQIIATNNYLQAIRSDRLDLIRQLNMHTHQNQHAIRVALVEKRFSIADFIMSKDPDSATEAIIQATYWGEYDTYMYLKNNGFEPQNGRGIRLDMVTYDAFKMIKYLLTKSWIQPSIGGNMQFDRQLKKYIQVDQNEERLDILEGILNHKNSELDSSLITMYIEPPKFKQKTYTFDAHTIEQMTPLWNFIFKHFQPSQFVKSFAKYYSFAFIKDIWDKNPSFRSVSNIRTLMTHTQSHELVLMLIHKIPLDEEQFKHFIHTFPHNTDIIKYIWDTYPECHSQDNATELFKNSDSHEIINMLLRNTTVKLFDSHIWHRIDECTMNNLDILYTMLSDPRTNNFHLSTSSYRDLFWRTQYSNYKDTISVEIAKMLLKLNQNSNSRATYHELWNMVLEEERNSVLRGRMLTTLHSKTPVNQDIALLIMFYDGSIFRHSSMLCAPKADMMAHYTTLFKSPNL